MKIKILMLFVVLSPFIVGQSTITSKIFNPNIHTLQVGIRGTSLSLPVIQLGGQDMINVSFDELSHEAHAYGYKITHCNSDWTPSNINSSEYLNGFTSANITDTKLSMNTTVVYTHYSFHLPNDEISFKISGNYIVSIYEDNQFDNPVAQACFSIVEPHSNITGTIRGNTDTELNTRLQQLDFEVDMAGYPVKDMLSEIKVVVRQNNRTDNQISNLQPTSFTDSKLSFLNNKDLIFEGGNEYHRFDASSVYVGGGGIDFIRMVRPNYHAYLLPNKIQTAKTYTQDYDVNGKYVINAQRASDVDVEADYMYVHFSIPTKNPFFDGLIYLGGEFNFNQIDESVKMNYSFENEAYTKELLLKQGGYNYQYWFKQKKINQLSVERVDGSYWQTNNEYSIYVYQRPWGERYDKLIGFKTIGK
jgi:Domain of unknown function (DUF5103)